MDDVTIENQDSRFVDSALLFDGRRRSKVADAQLYDSLRKNFDPNLSLFTKFVSVLDFSSRHSSLSSF